MYALKIKHINMQVILISQAFKIDHTILRNRNNTIKLLVII